MPPPKAHSRTSKRAARAAPIRTKSPTRSFFAAKRPGYRYFVGWFIVRHMCADGL
jgi:hypothetical protein